MDPPGEAPDPMWDADSLQYAIHLPIGETAANLALPDYDFCPLYESSSTQSLEHRALEAYYYEFGRPFVPWFPHSEAPEWSGYSVEEPAFGSSRDIHEGLSPNVDLALQSEVFPETNQTFHSHESPSSSESNHSTRDIHNTPRPSKNTTKARVLSISDEQETPFEVQWTMPEIIPTKSEGRPVDKDRFYTTTSDSLEQGVMACPKHTDFSLNKTPDERLAWELRDQLTTNELIVFFPKALTTYWGILKVMKETDWSISGFARQILIARGQHNDRCENRIRAFINKKVCAILREVTGDKKIKALSFVEDWVRNGKAPEVVAPDMKGLKDVLLRDMLKDIMVWPKDDKAGVFTKVARYAVDHAENWMVSETLEVAKAKEWM